MVAAPPAPPPLRVSLRVRYRHLIGIVAVQSFGNQMAGSFWIVYLVSAPGAVSFPTATLLWIVAFGTAALAVVMIASGRPIHSARSMTVGLAVMTGGHFAFALLPPAWAVPVAGLAFGLYVPLFWLPMNTLLVGETTRANRGARLAGVTATFTTIAIAAPVLGGAIASVAGYPLVFVLGGLVVASNLYLVRRQVRRDESFAFSVDLRRVAPRTALAFSGQGGADGLLLVATPLGAVLFTTNSLELGLLFALFSLAAGSGAIVLGRASDRARRRGMFLLLGPLLSLPACALAFGVRDIRAFALGVGWLSMTSALAPSLIYTILADRTEDHVPAMTASRELLLNVSRTAALLGGLGVLAFGADVYTLYLLVGGVIFLEALAK